MVVAMTTSSCLHRPPLPQQGWGLGEGAGEAEPEEVSAASSWLPLSSPHPRRGRRRSADAAAAAASAAGALAGLEGWFLSAPSPAGERGNKIPAAAADVGFGGCIRLGRKENGFSLHLSLLSTASPSLSMVSRRRWGCLLGLAAGSRTCGYICGRHLNNDSVGVGEGDVQTELGMERGRAPGRGK